MNEKILLIGNVDSIFIYKYIKNVLYNNNFDIYLITQTKGGSKFLDDVIALGVTVIDYDAEISGLIWKIPKLRGWVRKYVYKTKMQKFLKAEKFEHVHIHYVGSWLEKYNIDYIHKYTKNLICTFWGSDLLRSEATNFKINLLKSAQKISLGAKAQIDIFKEKYGDELSEKLYINYFGTDIFEAVDYIKKTYTPKSCKEYFGCESDKKVITIGYNASAAQQHDKVIEAISKLPKSILNDVNIILPFTYGELEEGYMEKIQGLCEKLECRYIILRDFLNSNQMSKLCMATDVFVHAQTTDAFSASVAQHLYIESNIVINNANIPYKEYKEWDIDYFEYTDFSDIPKLIEQNIYKEYKGKNRNKLKENLSDTNQAAKWLKLYNR